MRPLKDLRLLLLVTVAYLFPHPVFANQERENSDTTQLMWAAYAGDIHTMRQLIEQKHDVNQANKYGLTALYYAAGATRTQATPKGSTAAIKFLLQHGAKPNIKRENKGNGYTALMAACDNLNLASAALLLEYGADVNARTTGGDSALNIAAARLEPKLVKLLLEHGAHVNGDADSNGQTPLISAIAASPSLNYRSFEEAQEKLQRNAPQLAKAIEIVNLLLLHKAEVNIQDRNGKSALTHAITKVNLLLVRPLLEHGADPNVTDKSWSATPIILAARFGSVGIADVLIKKGANLNTKDGFGKSALDYALTSESQRMVKMLRKAGAIAQ